MKITIISYSGGGKTTLAKKISRQFNIPHQQIDRIWFGADGHKAKTLSEKEAARKVVEEQVLRFAKQDNWVSDGFYSHIQGVLANQADYVVVIELPLWKRLINHWKRIIKNEDRHPGVTRLEDFTHSFEIVKRTFTFKRKLEKFKDIYRNKIVILKSHSEIDKFFNKLVKNYTNA